MTTSRKLEANRRNAKLARGPRTAEGKAIASHNAVTHGLLSAEVYLPDDDKAAFQAFVDAMRADLAPVGELEALHADRAIANAWRLRRAMAVERQVFAREKAGADDLGNPLSFGRKRKDGTSLGLAFIRDCNGAGAVEKLARYETTLERGLMRALHELERCQAARQGAPVLPPAVLDVDVTVGHAEPTDAA